MIDGVSETDSSGVGGFREESTALSQILAALQSLNEESRQRVLRSVAAFFDLTPNVRQTAQLRHDDSEFSLSPSGAFSQDRTLSPKEFLLQKKPVRDVDRVACLAYYLTHFRDLPRFKTLDISKLNTEAAQIKFSNPAKAVDNAAAAGFLVAAGGGQKQLSAVGELYVQALPDRDAAKAAMEDVRPRRKKVRSRFSREIPPE